MILKHFAVNNEKPVNESVKIPISIKCIPEDPLEKIISPRIGIVKLEPLSERPIKL